MIPRTFPSILGALGETKMVVYVLPSVSGLQAWKDYIPVKGITTENTAVQNTYANDGYQVMSPLEDISTKQAWKDYIPVFEDASYTKAWSTDAGGYIPASGLFSVFSLFANNEQGVWYDPSDLTTLFQDAAGTTPVTAVEQPVGLMLDKSKGLVLGPELVTNGDFSNGTTGWTAYNGTIANVSGVLRVTQTASSYMSANTTISGLTVGSWYRLTVTFSAITNCANTQVWIGSSPGAAQDLNYSTGGTAPNTRNYYFVAGATSRLVQIVANATSGVIDIDNISVRELPGNHAYQSTSANRPTLSARHNLLTKTEQFDDAAWTKYNVTTPNSTTIKDNTSTNYHYIEYKNLSFTSGTAYKLQVRLEKGTVGFAGIHFYDNAARGCSVNLTTGQLGSAYGGATATAIADGTGWILTITATAAATTAIGTIAIYMSTSNALASYTGTGNGTIYVSKADLRVANDGVGIPAYQRVNTATDYDTVGFPKYLRFNGSSSAMVTNTITPGTDKAQVFAGVRKLSDAVKYTPVVELSTNAGQNNGAFQIIAPDEPNTYYFRSRGTSTANASSSQTFASPITNVISGIGSISGDQAILRVNGTQAAISIADQGTGNYGNYQMFIGATAGSSLWFNGRIYSMIVRFGSNLTTAQITNTENYVNTKTKAY